MNVRLALAASLLPAIIIATPLSAAAADPWDVCYVAVAEFQPAGSANADAAAAVSRAVAEAVSDTPSFAIVRDPGCAESLADSYMNPAHSIEGGPEVPVGESALRGPDRCRARLRPRRCPFRGRQGREHGYALSFHVRHLCAADEDLAVAGKAVAAKVAAGVEERREEMLRDLLPPEDRPRLPARVLRGPTAPRVALATMPWEKGDAAGRMDLAQASWTVAGEFLQEMGFTTVGPDDPPDWYVNAVIALDYTDRARDHTRGLHDGARQGVGRRPGTALRSVPLPTYPGRRNGSNGSGGGCPADRAHGSGSCPVAVQPARTGPGR